MNSEWQSATMSDVVTHYRGGEAFGKLEYASSGIPVIAKGDVKQYGNVSGSFSRFITEERWQEKRYKKTAKGDFVLTTRDLTQAANFLGLLAPVPEPYDFLVNQGANIVKFDHSVDPVYLVYWSHSSQYREHIKNSAVGSTQIHLRKEDFLSAPLLLPPLQKQKAIAHILGTLDDKIELNRKTSETLEAMAKALFKSWFVDFDPVRAKAEGRPTGLPAEISDLFPDSFEESELGEIPSGWEIKKIGDVISRFPVGKRFDQKTVSAKGSIPVLDQSASGIVGYHDEEAGVLATTDFPLFTFANHTCAMRYTTRPFSVIQNVFPLRGNGVDTAWLYQASQGKQEITEYKGHYPDFIEKQVVVPSNGVDRIYGGDYHAILIRCDSNLVESTFLASARDSLLPKLISGEIRIPDAEKMLEEVGI